MKLVKESVLSEKGKKILRDKKLGENKAIVRRTRTAKRVNEEINTEDINRAIYHNINYGRPEFFDVIKDIVERATYDIEDENYDIEEAVNQAIDDGMIYTDDQWEAYRHYCEMGDSVDVMWEGLFNDVYTIVNDLRK